MKSLYDHKAPHRNKSIKDFNNTGVQKDIDIERIQLNDIDLKIVLPKSIKVLKGI